MCKSESQVNFKDNSENKWFHEVYISYFGESGIEPWTSYSIMVLFIQHWDKYWYIFTKTVHY